MPETLAAKVATFPADLSDWAVCDALNAPDPALPTKRVKVPVHLVRGLIMADLDGAWNKLRRGQTKPEFPEALQDVCALTLATLSELQEFNTDVPETYAAVQTCAAALLAAGVYSQALHDALMAFADAPSSWADINNGGVPVTVQAVEQARREGSA